jgi:signal peptidase II
MKPKLKVFLGALLLTVPLDYATKRWIEASLTYADRLPVIEGFFYLTHVRNPGAAFGLFTTGPAELRQAFFIGVSLLAAILIVSFYRRLAPGDRFSALALGLVLGGAVGNLIDRVRYGEVIDFLHFRLWRGYSWPDFNLADSFIVTGVGFLVIELLASEGARRGDPSREENGRSPSG